MANRKRTADRQEHSDTLRNTKELHYNRYSYENVKFVHLIHFTLIVLGSEGPELIILGYKCWIILIKRHVVWSFEQNCDSQSQKLTNTAVVGSSATYQVSACLVLNVCLSLRLYSLNTI